MPIGPTTIKSTDPLAARQAAQRVKTLNNADVTLKQIIDRYKDGWNDLWANPLGLTPQQVCDSWGADAVAIINGAGTIKVAATIGLANQGKTQDQIDQTLKAAPQSITPNPDGTVTIGA